MRLRSALLAFCASLPLPAAAWEFSPEPVCTLSQQSAEVHTVIQFDPGSGLYQLDLTLGAGIWAPSPSFGMQFQGPAALTIGTAQHRIDGPRLTVVDRGFGNVLAGLERNARAVAFTASQRVTLPLEGATEPVQAFRACTKAPPLAGV